MESLEALVQDEEFSWASQKQVANRIKLDGLDIEAGQDLHGLEWAAEPVVEDDLFELDVIVVLGVGRPNLEIEQCHLYQILNFLAQLFVLIDHLLAFP